ncbi:MAG: MG2 domain-containing protein [Bacteroidota bacterium]
MEIGAEQNEWLLHNLDLSKVFDDYQNGLYLIRINFNPRDVLVALEENNLGYFQKKGQIYKPFTISDIGLLAKHADESYRVFTTDLKTGQPLPGVKVTSYSYNRNSSAVTNDQGVATIRSSYSARYLRAEKGDQISIIKPSEMRWNKSGFDVGGISSSDLKTRAYTYTERGVYRPGDSINLSCIVRFSSSSRSDVPVRLRLFNPEGTMVYEATQNTSRDGFYNFLLVTDQDAPTGNWDAQLNIGNNYFHHDLKIETVVANRLKVLVTPSLRTVLPENKSIQIDIESRFLFGTPAPGLPYDTEVQVFDLSNPFPKFSQYTFKDKMVDFQRARTQIGSGSLDAEGKATVNWNIPNLQSASTPIKAKILASVQEEGGRPNDAWTFIDIHPFSHYVGIDDTDRYIKLNTRSDIPVVAVDHEGNAVAGRELVYRIYRNESRWWYQYDSFREFKLRYKTDTHTRLVEEGTMNSSMPFANLPFQPAQRGQYLIEVQDAVYQGHTSSIFLSAYPYGAIPSGDQNAGTLILKSDKQAYQVGETASISFPSPQQGNVLLTIEQGEEILSTKWVQPAASQESMSVSIPITPEMAPNVYATVTVLQAHSQTVNDRPSRMFGILPIKVFDPSTKEELIISMPDELMPKQQFDVDISTASGKSTYLTVAVVDEGLLDLTNFKTPDPWKEFYKKIRLDIETYDMFGFVIGANEEDVFKTFSIGGDGDYRESQVDPFEKKKRFKPVCLFRGPVSTDANGKATLSFEMPNYVGSVRVMAISARGNRYGTAEKTVPVKSDLIVLPTVPRALKPGDTFKIPVNVIATRSNIGATTINIETEGPLEVQGESGFSHTFNEEGDQMFYFNVSAKEAIGQSKIVIRAKASSAESLYEADVAVSPGAARVYAQEDQTIEPGQEITFDLPKLGLDGTNNARLHLAVFPNLDFMHRLYWLIQYPYGCIEQTTSSAYPQLALKELLASDPKLSREIDDNINAAISRLSLFQLSNGGFSYWPGGNEASEWGSNYAGQFLIDADRQGYAVPEGMLSGIIRYLERKSRQPDTDEKWLMTRVNRAFILALANEAPLSEMNLLKQNHYEQMNSAQKWQLVAAYKLAGALDKVQGDVEQISQEVEDYSEFSHTYGSRYRDLGIILRCLVILEREDDAALMAKALAEQLSSRNWYSTQTLGQMLIGMGSYFDYAGIVPGDDLVIEGQITLPDGSTTSFKEANKLAQYMNEGYGGQLKVRLSEDVNTPKLFATLSSNGVPLVDQSEDQDKNLKVDITWFSEEGDVIDISSVKQGDVFYGRYQVSNISPVPTIDEVALVQMLPSGWEIENTRLSGELLPGWMSSYKTGQEEYLDIRDDRIMWFFDMGKERLDFIVKVNAITEGAYTLPGTVCEAMYNSDYQSTRKAQSVVVRSK